MKNNKGFSLVELIIVIAIMAILAAAIAPALIRYINKARIADDLTAAGEIVSAANTAMTNEDANDEVMSAGTGKVHLAKIDTTCTAASGFTGTSFIAELNKTLPNGAKKKYVKDITNKYYDLYISGDQFLVEDGDGNAMNPTPASPYDQ